MLQKVLSRSFHASSASLVKVAVLGAAGGIGQPLSLLLKDIDAITHLSLVDRAPDVIGVAADVGHVNTKAKVTGHTTSDLKAALEGASVVVIPAGVPRKPGMDRDALFNTNASIVADLVGACAKYCPTAHLLVISNPVNSTVPIAAGILKKAGVYDPKRLFGVTTLDVVRANNFLAESQGWDARKTEVTVVGGHAGITILPLFSQVKGSKLSADQIDKLTVRTQFGGDEVVKAKAVKAMVDGQEVAARGGSATLSMAYAGARFVYSLLRALSGEKGVSECAFVQSDAKPEAAFFATRIDLGKGGVEKIHPIGPLSAYEQAWLDKMMPELKDQIKKGVEFAASYTPKA